METYTKSKMIWQIIISKLFAISAPIVCLFYRKGWYLTPDDNTSPFGEYEPAMQWIYKTFGTWFGDYWWLGWRNRGYGLTYALKPSQFKNCETYSKFAQTHTTKKIWKDRIAVRKYTIDGYPEWTFNLVIFHIIVGYRVRPAIETRDFVRPINMDIRPILSIRTGGKDD